MQISVITPSIRPKGLEVTFKTLQKAGHPDIEWEWLPRLSVPGKTTDLAYQMNTALDEAKGELVVFLQDWIRIMPTGLINFWEAYQKDKTKCFTAPVGKIQDERRIMTTKLDGDNKDIKWDWRPFWPDEKTDFHRWEIDWGCAPRKLLLEAEGFDEIYDERGFGWENVDTAYKMHKLGATFGCLNKNIAVAWDHDSHVEHPYKDKPNRDLWITRKEVLDLKYGNG
jgi:hypothetical protein